MGSGGVGLLVILVDLRRGTWVRRGKERRELEVWMRLDATQIGEFFGQNPFIYYDSGKVYAVTGPDSRVWLISPW